MALQNETFEYNQLNNGYEFSHFANTGYLTELDIDFVADIEYIAGNNDPATNFRVVKDESKPIKSVREFTLNCDDKITTIRIGADVIPALIALSPRSKGPTRPIAEPMALGIRRPTSLTASKIKNITNTSQKREKDMFSLACLTEDNK